MPDFDTSGVTEIPPSPSNVIHVASAPQPGNATPVPIQPTPEEKAAYEAQFGPAPLNPIRDLSAQELADLAVQDKEHFDIVSAFRSQPELHGNPDVVQKAADALNLVKQRGFKLEDLPSPGQAVKGVITSAKGFGKQLWNYANIAGDVIGAAATAPFSSDASETFAKDVDKRLSANIAGTEEGMAGITDIGRKVIGKTARAVGLAKDFSQYTPEEKKNDLWAEVGRNEVQQERLKGQGPFTAAVTGGVAGEQNLKPEDTAELAAGDPFSFYTFGKGMQAAGGLVPGAAKAAISKAVTGAGKAAVEVVPKVGGGAVEAAGNAMELGGKAVQPVGKVISVAGPVVGGIAKLAGADTLGSVGGGILGGTAGVALRRAGEVAVDWARGVKDFGRQVAGSAPVKGAYAQAGKDFLQALPGAAGEVAKGAAVDLGLAAVTSETPQETEGMATFGTALGALHGAGKMVGHVISGQIIGPREYGVKTVTPSSGQFPALDAMHTQAIREASPGVRARLNAIREFLGGTQSGTDAYIAKDSAAVEQALTASGVSPATAKQWSKQLGFFTAELPGRDGTPRRVVVMRDVESAPHESFHVIQDVLGELANREIDKVVKESYADQWDHEGETYAKRLVGDLGGKTWQETILDASGWGLTEAKEKLFREIGNRIRNETGAEPPPGMVETQSKAALGQLMDEAVKNNPHLDPNEIAKHVWREVLSPAEAGEVADRYIARELAAENFDAAFKAGATKPASGSLPARLGRIAGNVVTALGGEPLAGRESAIGRVPLRTPVVEAVTKASKAKGTAPEVSAKVPSRPVTPTPGTPRPPTTPEEERVHNAEEARTIADTAPTGTPSGGLSSPRELLGQIAESIAKGEGIKLNYLSAPDEPAAATTSNRDTRRAIIETFRTMPKESRALWEKTFFPDRVIKTKTGYQVLGWAPEVFASNAHKMAAFLSDKSGLSPYEIDAKTKTFTPAAWQELYSDVQTFVQNQKSGTTGSGEPLVVPKSVSDRGYTQPAKKGGEVALDQNKADFINLLFNFKLPETGRTAKGKMPLNIAGQDVSEATQPGRVEVPVRPRADYAGEFTGRSVMEVNPLRNQIEAAAKAANVEMPSLIEAVQRLNLENIKEVQPAPEAPEFRGNTLTLSAGFQPERIVKEVSEMDAPQFQKWAEGQKGGFTMTAHDIGIKAPSREFVQDLKDKFKASTDLQRQQLADKKIDSYLAESFRSQFYREAYEAAEGSGSAGDYLRKKLGADYKPPFPVEEPSAQFSPKDEPGAVKRPAVKSLEDGKIYEGGTHYEALARARGSKPSNPPHLQGFVTNNGEFLDRREARKRAVQMGQIESDRWSPRQGELESVTFENSQAQPVASKDIQKVADDYAKAHDLPYVSNGERKYAALDQPTMEKLADFYEEAKHDPTNPEVKASYDALKDETVAQWDAIKAAGYDLEPYKGDGEPYKNSAEMLADVRENKHLFYLPTKGNFKGDENQAMLSEVDGKPVNDIFRAVHDFFGHAKEGYQFGPRGEYNAWKAHSEMYSDKAQGALAAETLAQNAWVNFGPHMRGESKPSAPERPFAEQKNTILPPELIDQARGQFSPRKKQDDLKLIRSATDYSNAWILPDGTPVQLGGMWHHQWLAEDEQGKAAAKRYGLKVPPFEEVDDSTTREAALKKGFVRLKYTKNNGKLTVEALASKWPAMKATVQDMVERNIDDIDSMTVNLLDNAVKGIVNSGSAKLFQFNTDKEKIENLPMMGDTQAATVRKTENPSFRTADAADEVLPSAYMGEPEFQVFDKSGNFVGTRPNYLEAKEAAAKIGGVAKVARTTRFQAQPEAEQEGLPGISSGREFVGNAAIANMTRDELGKHFPEAVIPTPRDVEIPSAITKSPLYKQAGSEHEAVKAFADKLVEFANEYKDDPSFKAGSEWYSKFSPMLKKAFGKDAQIFAELLAATSPQTAAGVNFSYAYDALRSLREGRFDKIIPKFEQGLDMIADDKWVPWYNKELKAGNIPKPPANPTPAAFLEAWINKHDLKPRQSNGALYGTHSIPVLQVFARKWLTESRGPKTLNFVKNLVGDGHEATIDLWADRTMRRVGYSGFKDRWRILPGNGTGVSPEDFSFGQKAFRSAAQKLNMKPDALQGALWFAEKKLWHDKGWGRLDLGDFATEMQKVPMMESGFKQRLSAEKTKTKKEQPLDLFEVQPRKLK